MDIEYNGRKLEHTVKKVLTVVCFCLSNSSNHKV